MIIDLAREHGVVERERKLDIRMIIWALVLGVGAGGDTRSIAGFRRAYQAATDQSVAPSSFYAWFTPALGDVLDDLLAHAIEEVAVPHTVRPEFERFRDVVVADTTIVRLRRFLAAFPASDPDESGMKLYLVQTLTEKSVLASTLTDERRHDSPLFETGTWMQGRLFLVDLGFFNYRRFALIDENDGFFVSRLKQSANPTITAELRAWPGQAIPLEGKQIHDVVGDLQRAELDVEVELAFKRRVYNGTRSTDQRRFRVVGVRDPDAADGYRLYLTNLPRAWFSPDAIATLYRARWEVELLFRELKSQYALGEFETTKPHIVRIQVLAALVTLVVTRAILRVLVDHAEERDDQVVFRRERWARTVQSVAQLLLRELATSYGYPPPNLAAFLYQELTQPSPTRLPLVEEVTTELCGDSHA